MSCTSLHSFICPIFVDVNEYFDNTLFFIGNEVPNERRLSTSFGCFVTHIKLRTEITKLEKIDSNNWNVSYQINQFCIFQHPQIIWNLTLFVLFEFIVNQILNAFILLPHSVKQCSLVNYMKRVRWLYQRLKCGMVDDTLPAPKPHSHSSCNWRYDLTLHQF